MREKIKVAPSVIAADQLKLGDEVKRMERAGADLLHIDIMDGHFVPNLTIGPDIVKAIDEVTQLPLDVHLMLSHPQKYLQAFIRAGADYLTVHIEACKKDAKSVLRQIKTQGIKAGLSLNPPTPLSAIKNLLNDVDLILVMSVNPGFYGQKFIPGVLPKIEALRRVYKGDIAVDGGINRETGGSAVSAGANILASGSYVFSAKDPRRAIQNLKNAAKFKFCTVHSLME